MGHGGERVKRVENLNGNEKFIGALADLASAQLRGGARCSTRMGLRYQECRSDRFTEQKKLFAGAADSGGEASIIINSLREPEQILIEAFMSKQRKDSPSMYKYICTYIPKYLVTSWSLWHGIKRDISDLQSW